MRLTPLIVATFVGTLAVAVLPSLLSADQPITPVVWADNNVSVQGQTCPQWVHDRYSVVGPDGHTYPTWHPIVDPEFGCVFGHEHGADPKSSRANSDLPPFGYAAAQMGMDENHIGFKVFVLNAGDTVESNVPDKTADQNVRIVFHMGTSGVKRFTEPLHSMQLDVIDENDGRYAHVFGMADTGSIDQAGSTCDAPRRGGKDFSTISCADPYEIWNGVRFQIVDPADPFQGIDQSRFGAVPSVAVFDPVTSRDPSDNSRVLFTEALRGDPLSRPGIDPQSTDAAYKGCSREMYAGPFYWHNAGQRTVYFTDALGRVSADGGQDATHMTQQIVSSETGVGATLWKKRQDFCAEGVHFPN
ncbi:MAG: hypothetical protein NVSMB2_25980 [Chloroflexota bacterium]